MDMVALAISILEKSKQNLTSKPIQGHFCPLFFKPMKTSNNYSPKVSIEVKTLETLLKTCTDAINHSVQTEVFINHNPQVHARELRKALKTVETELNEQKKQWICFSKL